ncbi:hypothetical protein [Cellulomonas hominis]
MALFSRRPALPAALKEQLDLRPGDRILAAAELTEERWAVATRRALYVTGSAGAFDRHPWSDVDRANLTAETSTITVRWIDGTHEDLPLTGSSPSAFAQTLRERVQSSVVQAETVRVPGGRQVQIALRRDEDGALLTQVVGDGRVDLADPAVAAVVNSAEEQLRAAAGLRG